MTLQAMAWVKERLDRLDRGEFAGTILPGFPTLVVHVVPTLAQCSLEPLQMAHCGLRPPDSILGRDAVCDHELGFLAHSNTSYSLLFRTGATESVFAIPLDKSKQPTRVYGQKIEEVARRAVENSVASIRRCAATDPLLVCIRLLNMSDVAVVDERNNSPWLEPRAHGQPTLELPYFSFERDEPGRSLADCLNEVLENLW